MSNLDRQQNNGSQIDQFNHTPEGMNPFQHYGQQFESAITEGHNDPGFRGEIRNYGSQVAFSQKRAVQACAVETEIKAYISYLATLDRLDGGNRAQKARQLDQQTKQIEKQVWSQG